MFGRNDNLKGFNDLVTHIYSIYVAKIINIFGWKHVFPTETRSLNRCNLKFFIYQQKVIQSGAHQQYENPRPLQFLFEKNYISSPIG